VSPEAQRIAIAEACGWKKYRNGRPKAESDIPEANAILWEFDFVPPGNKKGFEKVVPYYLTNLNAMHDAEKVLVGHQRFGYFSKLCDACCTKECCLSECASATAAQRAEAFLRTIGKWEDAK